VMLSLTPGVSANPPKWQVAACATPTELGFGRGLP